jgi:hypothetical protein
MAKTTHGSAATYSAFVLSLHEGSYPDTHLELNIEQRGPIQDVRIHPDQRVAWFTGCSTRFATSVLAV